MMKILWLSNKSIMDSKISSSGTWLYSMSRNLCSNYAISICNITEHSGLKYIEETENGKLKEWRLPKYKLKDGLPSKRAQQKISQIIEKENPDLIHVWGVENYWGLLITRGVVSGYSTLLEIQGVLYACCDYYKGGTTLLTFLRNQPIINALYSYCYISLQHFKFNKRLGQEEEIISGFKDIAVQSDWTLHKVSKFAKQGTTFHRSLRPVRKQFRERTKWRCEDSNQNTILTIASIETYKALHTTILAIAALKKHNSEIKLSVIGVSGVIEKIPRGYALFIKDLIRNLHLEDTVKLKGGLPAEQIIEEMKTARCFVISSFVESYSAVMAEAMNFGIPVVVSYSGAMVEFGNNNESVLYYTPGDYVECAEKIRRIISSEEMCKTLSFNSLQATTDRNKEESVAHNQYAIYHNILDRR